MDFGKYKVIAADIDGTLLGDDHKIGSITREALKKAHESGMLIGVASGRPIDFRMARYKDEWALGFPLDFYIGMNGGQLRIGDVGEVKKYHLLSKETIREIMEMMRPLDLNPFIYRDETMVCVREDEDILSSSKRNGVPYRCVKDYSEFWEEENNKILYRVEHGMDQVYKWAQEHSSDRWQFVLTQPTMLEFFDPHNNKGNGLKEYAKETGIPLSQMIGFGDMDNDIPLLETAGLGVCLANGCQEAKEVADEVTEYDASHDGVGKYLLKKFR